MIPIRARARAAALGTFSWFHLFLWVRTQAKSQARPGDRGAAPSGVSQRLGTLRRTMASKG